MSHEVETMAYAYDAKKATGDFWSDNAYEHPWHKDMTGDKSVAVNPDMSPAEMLKKAGLDWKVERAPAYITTQDNTEVPTGQHVIYRDKDNKILTPCSPNWCVTQPSDFADFFAEFCAEGSMEMNTMGSLMQGKRLFALARVKDEEFSLFRGKDVVQAYFLFSMPYIYGEALDLRFTPTRVVCWNTLSMAIDKKANENLGVRVSHRKEFDPEAVKEVLGIAQTKMAGYKEAAEYLASKRFSVDKLKEYYATVFPKRGQDPAKDKVLELGKPAQLAMDMLEIQPGAELGEGSWWQAYNAATYAVDHKFSRTDEKRMDSAWFGNGKNMKTKALTTALKFADA